MATQAEKIKAFHLAQHARLQKEDEDEWISGEELRTEGSSDEEASPKPTSNGGAVGGRRKKERRKKRPQNAEPPTLASTQTGRKRDNFATTLPKIGGNGDRIAARSKSCCAIGEADEEGADLVSEDDLRMQWRPKRGSLRLPTVSEGQSLYNMAVKMQLFHEDMLLKVKNMRSSLTFAEDRDDDRRLLGIREEEDEEIEAKEEKEPAFRRVRFKDRILEDIQRRDEAIASMAHALEEIRSSNEKVEAGDLGEFVGNLQNYACQDEIEINQQQPKQRNDDDEDNLNEKKSKKKHQQEKDQNFIKRNIKLSKAGGMNGCSLTDEEKVKLDDLLSEIDVDEKLEEAEKTDRENEKALAIKDSTEELDIDSIANYCQTSLNPFKLDEEETKCLLEMETKMQEIIASEEMTASNAANQEPEDADLIGKYYETGKLWKCELMNKRLGEINKHLSTINQKKLEEEAVPTGIKVESFNFDYSVDIDEYKDDDDDDDVDDNIATKDIAE